ncbi:MAG: hypothetical protein WC554_18705 [Clostridia bacterium]
MRISIEIGAYNQRRYSRPWIGKITSWPVGARPELAWGGYAGDDSGGELEIEAQPDDIIRWGQKDGRGNGGSNEWGIAQADGTVEACDQPQARAHWTKMQTPVAVPEQTPVDPIRLIPDDALIAEIRRRGLTVTQEVIA